MAPLKHLLSAVIIAGLLPAAVAQTSQPLSLVWKVQADDPQSTYILSTGDAARGMFLNQNPGTGGSLLVASRHNDTFVRRLDPATGALKDPAVIPNTYNTTGTTFAINKVVVSGDGVIYVMGLGIVNNTSEQHFRIYRHATESTPETLAADIRTDNFTGNGEPGINKRLGDDADISGTGNDTKILVAGLAGSLSLFTTTDGGLTFTRTDLTATPPITGTPHIAWDPTTPNRFFYRGTSGEQARAYDISGSTATGATGPGNDLPSQTVAEAYGPFDIGPVRGVKSIVLGIGPSAKDSNDKPILVFRLSDLQTDYFGLASEFTGGAKANGNGAGDVYLDSINNIVYVLYTNNSITKYTIPPAAVSDRSISHPGK